MCREKVRLRRSKKAQSLAVSIYIFQRNVSVNEKGTLLNHLCIPLRIILDSTYELSIVLSIMYIYVNLCVIIIHLYVNISLILKNSGGSGPFESKL